MATAPYLPIPIMPEGRRTLDGQNLLLGNFSRQPIVPIPVGGPATATEAPAISVDAPLTPLQRRTRLLNWQMENGGSNVAPAGYSLGNPVDDLGVQREAQLYVGAQRGREAVANLMRQQWQSGQRGEGDGLPVGFQGTGKELAALVPQRPTFNPNGVNVVGGQRFAFKDGQVVGGNSTNIVTIPTTPTVAPDGFTPAQQAGQQLGLQNALNLAATAPRFTPPRIQPQAAPAQSVVSLTPSTQAGQPVIPTETAVEAVRASRLTPPPFAGVPTLAQVQQDMAKQAAPATPTLDSNLKQIEQRELREKLDQEVDWYAKKKEQAEALMKTLKPKLDSKMEGSNPISAADYKRLKDRYEAAEQNAKNLEAEINKRKK